jgi:hypothetical protein
MLAALAATRPDRRAAWLGPAVPAIVVTGYLAWGAWVSARDPRWLTRSQAWWRVLLRPGDSRAIIAVVALWLAALACYWWPRRRQPRLVGLAIVVGMVLIGGALGTAALAPCRGDQTGASVAAGVLDLYVGQPAAYPPQPPVCAAEPSLALQLASAVCLGATLVGALAAAAVLWQQPVDRLRARMVRDATVVVGLDAMTIPLLRKLAETGRPGGIVVIEPDASHPLLDEARATGARIMTANPASRQVLLPVLAGRRGCALSYLYALRPNVADNEAIMATACGILRRYRPDPERQPHLVVRIDDPRHAGHWRGRHGGTADPWFEDALSPQETTASALVTRVCANGARQLLLCGDSTLALAILLEVAYRSWERRGLARAAELGRAVRPDARLDGPGAPEPVAAPPLIERVVLLDQRAGDLRREYLATSPQSMTAALPAIRMQRKPWKDHLLALLDGMRAAEAAETAVVVADLLTEGSMHEAGRAARLHPGVPVFVLSPDGSGASEAIFDLMQPFQRALLVNGDPPEDTWTRIARHWHECYRLTHPVTDGATPAAARRPWAELDVFLRQDNILQLRSVMGAVAARGRRWMPASAVPAGSFIELAERDLAEVARAEHTRWYLRRWAAGWRPTAPANGAGHGHRPGRGTLVNGSVVPWADLPGAQRAELVEHVRTQLAQLEDVGFMPIVPEGGPATAASYRRVGTVRARRLEAALRWTTSAGSELSGRAGDWHVLDDHGDERTVRDLEFRASHELLGGHRWRRTGTFRAWPASDELVVRTVEGPAVARRGDWIVEGPGKERWPVTDEHFRRGYQAVPPG